MTGIIFDIILIALNLATITIVLKMWRDKK